MRAEAYINIVLQTFGGTISLLLWIFLQFIRRERNRLDQLYTRFLLANTLIQFLNVVSWYFHGKPGPGVFVIVTVSDFLLYVFHYLILGTITDYLVAFLEKNGARCRYVSRIVWAISLIGIALVVVAQFNGMYYIIDSQNGYHRQAGLIIFAGIGVIGVTIDIVLFLRYRRVLRTKEYHVLTACLILSFFSAVFQVMVLGRFYLYFLTTFIAICIYIFIQVEQSHMLNEKALELEKVQNVMIQKELEVERSRVAVMISQIQPHFLYNALTGIKELCNADPEKAQDAMEHFSYFLRSNLDSLADQRLIPLDKEIKHVKDYFYLEKMRFKDRVNLSFEIDYHDVFLPPLTLQPLVENAVRYGIMKKNGGGTVSIHSEKIRNEVVITVRDDGVGFDVSADRDDGITHTGIENVRKRLELQCKATMEIQSKKGRGTNVRITLPLEEVFDEYYSG